MYDIFLLFLLLGGLALGFAVGLVRQAINIAGLYFGLVFASYYHPAITRFVRERVGEADSLGREALLFFVVFGIVWLLINVGAFFSFRQAPRFLPDLLDRLIGMVLGIVTGVLAAVIITLLLTYATQISWPQNDGLRLAIGASIEDSVLRPILGRFLPLVANTLEPWLPRGLPNFFTTPNL